MDVEDSSPSESSYSGSEEPERPNRWTGPSSTWQALTAQERGLEASLVELRNRDLSIHLYNSFALKRNARGYRVAKNLKTSPSPSRENQAADDDQDMDKLVGNGWAPPRGWTAWPLPPEQVPRPDEHVGPEDEDDVFTFKMKEREWPSRELEEVVVSTALKFAKERWQEREMASSDEYLKEETSSGGKMNLEELERVEVEDEHSREVLDDHVLSAGGHNPVVKKSSEPPPEKAILKPVQSADDERSRDLLRPSIRHTLSQLDDVLMALHHARQTYHRYATDSNFNTEEDTDNDENAPSETNGEELNPEKRSRGRPGKFENLTSRPKVADENISEPIDVDLWRTKKSHRGRPKKRYELLQGESQEEYLVRIARLQKKSLPSFTSSRASSRALSSHAPSSRGTSPERSPVRMRRGSLKREERLGMRDWSEVLGSAALVGFHPDIIARTAQRCADLFGEGISMRNLSQTASGATGSHFLTTYMPEEIPDLGNELQTSSEESEEEDILTKEHEAKKPRAPVPGQHNWPCPIENCPRQAQGFSHNSWLVRHLVKSHGFTNDEANKLLNDDEEMHGGVHIDGFLKPIKNLKGARGGDKRPRSSGRWAKESSILEGDGPSNEKIEDEDPIISSGS